MSEPNVSEIPADVAGDDSKEGAKPAERVTGVDLAAQVAALTAERDQLLVGKAETHDLLQRRQAEFDNFRRRTERERSEFVQYAGMELIREILPVVDDFERALKAESGSADYARGVEMIYSRMVEILRKTGLEPIDTQLKSFDPHLHQAVEKVQTADAEDHTVIGEFQKGYFFKGKLLRPAMVRVAVRP